MSPNKIEQNTPPEGQYITANSSGVWVYRRRVPQDLIEYFGRREIKLSLKTTDHLMAMLVVRVLDADVGQSFEDARVVLKRRLGLMDEMEAELQHPLEVVLSEAKVLTDDALSRLSSAKELESDDP